jgi:hypothetical protein
MVHAMSRWYGKAEVEKVKASGKHKVKVVCTRIQLRIASFSAGVVIL